MSIKLGNQLVLEEKMNYKIESNEAMLLDGKGSAFINLV